MASVQLTPNDEIFLPKPDAPGEFVDFGATLKDIDGKYVLRDVNENGLAYSAGFRTGGILLTVNDTSTEGKGVQFILDFLRDTTRVNLLLAVERRLGEDIARFIWIIFKVVIKDGVPRVDVIQLLSNDTFEMPLVDLTGNLDFIGRSYNTYDIFIDTFNEKPLYLTIQKKKAVFDVYDGNNSKFYKYMYSGGDPSKGVVVAYSTEKMDPPPKNKNPTDDKNTIAGTAKQKMEVLDFPTYMVGSDILPNPRFWYEKLDNRRASYNLESYKANGYFLGKDNDNKAILSKKKTELAIAHSDGRLGKGEGCDDPATPHASEVAGTS